MRWGKNEIVLTFLGLSIVFGLATSLQASRVTSFRELRSNILVTESVSQVTQYIKDWVINYVRLARESVRVNLCRWKKIQNEDSGGKIKRGKENGGILHKKRGKRLKNASFWGYYLNKFREAPPIPIFFVVEKTNLYRGGGGGVNEVNLT